MNNEATKENFEINGSKNANIDQTEIVFVFVIQRRY
jgi:hypothetical protein